VFGQLQAAAVADVRDRLSRFIGTVRFVEDQGSVRMTGTLSNLPPGSHGFHIDNVAKCVSPTFNSAGSIFNPTDKKHGLRNPAGPQVGDLPSLVVSADGVAKVDLMVRGASLSNGQTSFIGGNGTALVIHVGDDDQLTDPEGNAGERLACGVILPTDAVAASATAQSRGPSAAAAAPVQGVVAQTSPLPAVVAQQQSAAAPQQPAAGTQQQPAAAPQQPAAATPRGPSDTGSALGSPLIIGLLGVLLISVGYLLRRPTRG
jgi:Cu-Zn family superoxide dismutase